MKNVKIDFVFAFAAALTMGVCAKDATDGLVGWWRVEKKPNGTVFQPADLRDHAHVGSAAELVNHATEDGEFPAYPVCHTNLDLAYPMGSGIIPDAPCLYFRQPTNYTADGICYLNRQRIVIPADKIDLAGQPCTFIARIKPMPAVVPGSLTVFSYDYSWGNNRGWRVFLNPQSSGKSVNWAYPAVYVGKTSAVSSFTAGSGHNRWHDLGVSIEPNMPESGKTRVIFYFCDGNGHLSGPGGNKTLVQTNIVASLSGNSDDAASRKICIGDLEGYDTYSEKKADKNTETFRGLIHEMKLYDRVLTKEEFEQACAPYSDPLFSVGSKNGSTDEFSDETAEPVYEPFTMPWCKLRKTLTLSNPSISIKTSVTEADKDVSRILEFTPLYSEDCPADAALEVLLNGRSVAKVQRNSETDRLVHLNGKTIANLLTLTDGKYPLTLTLKRIGGMGGTISFDRISLGGGWQLGVKDSSHGEFKSWNGNSLYNYYTYYLSRQDASLIPAPYYTSDVKQQMLRLMFSVSDALSELGEFEFSTRHNGVHGVEIYLNDHLISTKSKAKGENYTVVIPKGAVKSGINEILLKVVDGEGMFTFDYFRLEPKRFPRGTIYVIR